MASLVLWAYHEESGLTYNGLPAVPVDDDFYDYLLEEASDENSIDIGELGMLWLSWAKENVCN